MKQGFKFLTVALSSVFAVSLLAGCGGNGDENPSGGDDETNLPALPTPETVVSPFDSKDATFTLDGTVHKNFPISESLFGVFLEDINYAGYLLDDNLVVNGSFETFDQNKSLGWDTVNSTLAVESSSGVLKDQALYAAKGVNANYAALKVTAAGGGITSSGHTYLPIAVTENTDYLFSAFVKSSSAVNMTVRIKDGNSTYAEKVIKLKSDGGWVKYQATLTSNGTADSGVLFEISFDEAGTYYLDGIQLETTDSTGGIKQYVYDAIKQLSPKFIRFPGGCIIEGDSAAGGADCTEIYDWKNSVGAVQNGDNAGDDTIPEFTYTLVKDGAESTVTTQGEWITRKQNGDLWGYDMEYGVGFYEYFLLCDSLGASALPVLNCGLSDMGGAASGASIKLNGRHGKMVEDYIQDAINLIEFAKGGTDTKWGALRAALGHEEPFKMDYIGIGNEQSGAEYFKDCYEKFLASEAFREALSEYGVTPIVGNGMFLENCRNTTKNANGIYLTEKGTAQRAAEEALKNKVIDTISDYGVHDQHYYVNWTKLLENYAMYDEYATPRDEEYYGVFVGEYSANTDLAGYSYYKNPLIAALSEAAMMTSYERNGSVVKLAAYAPMFGVANRAANATTGGNDSANQWPVDMMYYTNREIVRTANYYVQQMFMNNSGVSYLYKSKMNWSSEEMFEFPAESGSGSKTFHKLYYSASKSADGDLLLKVVNVSGEAVKVNVDIQNATGRNFAYVTELNSDDFKATNTLNKTAVAPVSTSIGWEGQSFGYAFKPYSLTVLRIPTK